MKYLKTFNEMIKVPIKVGDTILGGRFKNNKVVVVDPMLKGKERY
jgi:hypothetical protein